MIDLIVICIIVWLALWSEHWFPWELALRRKLPRLAAYVVGVLAMIIPLSGLYWHWLTHPCTYPYCYLVALWSVVIVGGLAVISAWGVDWVLMRLARLPEIEEILEINDGRQAE